MISVPDTNELSSEANQLTAAAISSGRPNRPDGNLRHVAVPVEMAELVSHHHVGDDRAGADGVDPHADGPELDRGDLGQPAERELAGRVGAKAMASDEPAN